MGAALEMVYDDVSLNDGRTIMIRLENNFCYFPVLRTFSRSKLTKSEKDFIIFNLRLLVDTYNDRNKNGVAEFYNIEKCYYLSDDEFSGAFFYWKTISEEKTFSKALDDFINLMLQSGHQFAGLDKNGNPKTRIYSKNVVNILLDKVGMFNEYLVFTSGATFIFKYLRALLYYKRESDYAYFVQNFSFFGNPSSSAMTAIDMSLEINLH